MKKIVSFVSLLILAFQFLGCAKAKYADTAANSNPGVEKSNSTQVTCDHIFESSRLCLEWQWEVKPTAKSQGSIVFKTYRLNTFDQSLVYVDLSVLPELVLWMPGMGHGSTPTQVQQLDTGTYRASNVFFIMPGEWDLQFQLKSQQNVIDKVYVSIRI